MQQKIICFTDSLGSGGAQRQLVGLACMLKERGYDVSVVLYHDSPFYKPQLDDAGIESTVVKSSNNLGRIWALYKYFKKHKGATIIAYQETPSLIASLLRPFIGCSKLIVSERNTTQVLTKKDKLRFWLYRYADYVVPNSYSQANFIRGHFPKLASKVVCITNFVNTDLFSPQEKAYYDQNILVVASRKPEKNFNRFIGAIRKLKGKNISLHVDWYGIPNEQAKPFNDYLKSFSLSEVVTVHPPNPNIVEAYRDADYFCLPSLYEGFPNVLCEAMSCGLPVVCSKVCDNPSIVEESINGFLFDPKDVDNMANTIEQLLSLSNESKIKMSMQNRGKAVRSFSQKAFVEKYITLINS